jgi:hypothetical protein
MKKLQYMMIIALLMSALSCKASGQISAKDQNTYIELVKNTKFSQHDRRRTLAQVLEENPIFYNPAGGDEDGNRPYDPAWSVYQNKDGIFVRLSVHVNPLFEFKSAVSRGLRDALDESMMSESGYGAMRYGELFDFVRTMNNIVAEEFNTQSKKGGVRLNTKQFPTITPEFISWIFETNNEKYTADDYPIAELGGGLMSSIDYDFKISKDKKSAELYDVSIWSGYVFNDLLYTGDYYEDRPIPANDQKLYSELLTAIEEDSYYPLFALQIQFDTLKADVEGETYLVTKDDVYDILFTPSADYVFEPLFVIVQRMLVNGHYGIDDTYDANYIQLLAEGL